MAESVCEVERNRNEKIRLMSENGEFMSVNSMNRMEDNGLSGLNNIFYLNNLENNCFDKYEVNGSDGVNRASGFCPHVDDGIYKGICPNNDENCRRKRCSDRYDSSESSDSGIAVSSSASSGTSDITDPGSPFSTSSDDSSSSPGKCKESIKRCKSEEKSTEWTETGGKGRCRSEEKTTWNTQQTDKTDHNFITPETDFKMAPNVPSSSSPCDIWTSVSKEPNTANSTAHFNHFNKTSEAISCNNKRLKIDDCEISPIVNNNNNNVPVVESDGKKDPKSRRSSVDKKAKTARHQGKITEYFKSQIKPLVGVKRNVVHKIAVKKSEEPSAKKLRSDYLPVFVKPSPKTVMPFPEPPRHPVLSKLPKTPEFLLKKPPETKTLFNKILQNHKNRKLAEKTSRTAAVKPAVVAAAAAAPSPADEVLKSSHNPKPYESSTRINNNSELPKSNINELSSNILDDKVQNKKLDSNLLNVDSKKLTDSIVNCEDVVVISNGGDAAESNSCSSFSSSSSSSFSSSPILSAPRTIRFPANSCRNDRDGKHMTRESIPCRWNACAVQFESASGLLDHLQTAHVLTQVSGEKFVCLWVGCKVFDQKSCSRSWLERHVLSHAGNKPYRCIVDGCGQGFSTQAILERHVNSHFAADVKKALDSSIAHKLFRRNGKKLRYRRQPWSARMFDYFDSGIMECLEYRLVKLTKARTRGDVAETPGKSLALTSQVIARRMTDSGRQQFLLRWYPLDIVEDEWVYEKEIKRRKMVSIPNLSPSSSSTLQETLESAVRSPGASKRKNKGTCRKIEPQIPVSTPEKPEIEEDAEEQEPEIKSSAPEQSSDSPDLKSEEPELPPPKKVPDKKPKPKKQKKFEKIKSDMIDPATLPVVSIPVVDISKDGTLTTEKTVSRKPKEDEKIPAVPEEMSMVPVCREEMSMTPIMAAPMKTEMILSSPVKLVASQFIEQMPVTYQLPVQMPVTYQIPIVKLNQPSGMFLPQIPNYIISQSPAVFPPSPVPAFRNGFQLSNLSSGTIQIQTSTTTLHQTATSNFMQSTTNSGFQILQSPGMQQSILTAFQNSGIANLNLKSPTLRLLNCQPLILNNTKPIANMSMTLANVSSIANNTSALTIQPPTPPPPGPPPTETKPRKIISPKNKKLNILPKPNLTGKNGVSDGSKSKKQCLQPCGPTTRAAT